MIRGLYSCSDIYKYIYIYDDAFFNRTGLERVGVVGPD